MSAIDFATVENAVYAWVSGASGLEAIWEGQGGVRPPLPYISMQLTDIRGIGHDWIKTEENEDYDPEDEEETGLELRRLARGMRTAVLELTCFGKAAKADAAAVNPQPFLVEVVGALPHHEEALDVAGIGIGDVSPVSVLGGSAAPILDLRARCEVTVHLASEVVGFIEEVRRVQITVSVHNEEGDEIHSEEKWIPDDPPPPPDPPPP